VNPSDINPLKWQDDALVLIDQRVLPGEEIWTQNRTVAEVVSAIRDMVVRGAPAIGIAGAYGMVFAADAAWQLAGAGWRKAWLADVDALRHARLEHAAGIEGAPRDAMLAEAIRIHTEDLAANHRMGELGAALIEPGVRVMTHCNAGALATAGHGTALGVIRDAYAAGRIVEVFATETRPWLQGARLTSWELSRSGIPVRLITDGSAAHVMRTQGVRWVIVGADRVAANGDVANKIGTYSLAIAAKAHGAKVMVVAPRSTIDLATATGDDIEIEERTGSEITTIGGRRYAPEEVTAFNPVFDVTPAHLIDALVTEVGVVHKPDREGLARLLAP